MYVCSLIDADFVCAGLQSLTKKSCTKSINILHFLCFCGFDCSLRQIFPFCWNSLCKLRCRFQMMGEIRLVQLNLAMVEMDSVYSFIIPLVL